MVEPRASAEALLILNVWLTLNTAGWTSYQFAVLIGRPQLPRPRISGTWSNHARQQNARSKYASQYGARHAWRWPRGIIRRPGGFCFSCLAGRAPAAYLGIRQHPAFLRWRHLNDGNFLPSSRLDAPDYFPGLGCAVNVRRASFYAPPAYINPVTKLLPKALIL